MVHRICKLCHQLTKGHRVCLLCKTPIHYKIYRDKPSDRPYNLAVGILCWYCADSILTKEKLEMILK